jgi:hypothetical protein
MDQQTHLERQRRQGAKLAPSACTRLHFIDIASGTTSAGNVDGDIDLTDAMA